ncbi:MAG: ABC transporter permease [Candidatus Nanopelagicales bacterium]
MTARTRAGATTAGVAQSVLSFWFVLPVVPILLWAIADRWAYPAVLPTQWGLAGIGSALEGQGLRALLTSFALGLLTAALATPAGAMAAQALPRMAQRVRRLAAVVVLAPVVVPPLVIALGINVVLLRLRVPAPVGVALVLAALAVPYTFLVMRAAFAGYDPDVEHQARLLGAGPRQVLWRIRMPALRRPLAMASLLAFVIGSTDYIVTVVVGGGTLVSVPVLVAAAASGSGNDSRLAALSIAALLPAAALALVLLATGRRPRRDDRAASMPARQLQEVA